ncbi:MAG TPA: DUF1294 domain-containing protein [Bacillota bacterium]|nr:DUF1294 domain-containing protein [Bacillota bacterium]
MLKVIVIGLLILNIIGFGAVALDKYKAIHRKWRIPERFFFIIATLGASIGVLSGCHLFHHKTQHNSFMWGLPAILAAQLAGVVYFWWH